MKLKIEYTRLDGSPSEFLKCKLVGTYRAEGITVGFKVFDDTKKFRNIRYTGIKSIKAA